eukprot:IDg9514t1
MHSLNLYNWRREMPRTFSPSVHDKKQNDLFRFDFIDLGTATDGEKYVLMLRDDHSVSMSTSVGKAYKTLET